MTRINEYLWQLPHTSEEGDPPDVSVLQEMFNNPVIFTLQQLLGEAGYDLKGNDIMVRLDDRIDRTYDTYYANVRFIHYIRPDVLTRVHFQHSEWAHFLPSSEEHRFFINLDRFKIIDPTTQIAVPGWEGRLHTRVTSLPGELLHFQADDQIWVYKSMQELEDHLRLFWEKFTSRGQGWLEDTATL